MHATAEVDAQDDSRATALLVSVTGRHEAAVEVLVKPKADANIAADGGHTPLTRARQLRSKAMGAMLQRAF